MFIKVFEGCKESRVWGVEWSLAMALERYAEQCGTTKKEKKEKKDEQSFVALGWMMRFLTG